MNNKVIILKKHFCLSNLNYVPNCQILMNHRTIDSSPNIPKLLFLTLITREMKYLSIGFNCFLFSNNSTALTSSSTKSNIMSKLSQDSILKIMPNQLSENILNNGLREVYLSSGSWRNWFKATLNAKQLMMRTWISFSDLNVEEINKYMNISKEYRNLTIFCLNDYQSEVYLNLIKKFSSSIVTLHVKHLFLNNNQDVEEIILPNLINLNIEFVSQNIIKMLLAANPSVQSLSLKYSTSCSEVIKFLSDNQELLILEISDHIFEDMFEENNNNQFTFKLQKLLVTECRTDSYLENFAEFLKSQDDLNTIGMNANETETIKFLFEEVSVSRLLIRFDSNDYSSLNEIVLDVNMIITELEFETVQQIPLEVLKLFLNALPKLKILHIGVISNEAVKYVAENMKETMYITFNRVLNNENSISYYKMLKKKNSGINKNIEFYFEYL